jgi:hypothetical protein
MPVFIGIGPLVVPYIIMEPSIERADGGLLVSGLYWTGVESWIKTGALGYSTSAFFENTSNICGETVELEIGGASSESCSFPIYCF